MVIWVLLGSVLGGALALVAWRLATGVSDRLTHVVRSLLGLMAGGLGGTSLGAAMGVVLGQFVGFQPGDPHNAGFVATALGLLGLVIGSLCGLMLLQRRAAGSP